MHAAMIEKNYNPKDFEEKLYQQEEKYFETKHEGGEPFCVIMPPPNVTGSLHLGHALTYTLQDILIRYKRMNGFDAFWQPGTDHAGIATQMVVERELLKEGKTRQSIGRKAFLERAWEWKEYSKNTIVSQQRRLCIAADWSKSKFTLDEDVSKAVRKVFVDLYKKGLIYKDKRLVNWDTHFQTAISDLEVINKPQNGKFWYVRYLVVDSTEEVIVATTRPETLFADQAVAVHPEDERYQHLIGQYVHLPLTDKTIPIIADNYCNKELGTGAVKITPAHDFNDFEVGKRHHLAFLNILNKDGTLNENVPLKYQNLDILNAREEVLKDLGDLLLKEEEKQIVIPYGDRSNVQIQPFLTDQWFIDTKGMAKEALSAVENGKTTFVPKQWENTYFEWLKDIQPWCISRQLWWGHQIPVWYSEDRTEFVAETEDEACQMAKEHFGKDVILTQDADVLDTWFSSALWPFTTLGWPNKTEALKKYYPTSVLVTGFDIIFFWVARMMMMGLHFMKEVPFQSVYIHPLVRDEKGQKMSKSKGNVIDPMDLIEKFGADALRFTLCILSTPGRDIKIGESKVENYRNFITKIYNSARFLEMNACIDEDKKFDPANVSHPLSRFMIQEIGICIQNAKKNLDDMRFDLYAQDVFHWFWNVYCDQFLESLKAILQNNEEDSIKQESRQTARYCFIQILKILHPVIPMMTEHLWKIFCEQEDMLVNQRLNDAIYVFEDDQKIIQTVFDLSSFVRSLKGLLGLTPSERFTLYIKDNKNLMAFESVIVSLARLNKIVFCDDNEEKRTTFVPFVYLGIEGFLELHSEEDTILAKNVFMQKKETLEKDITRLKTKLSNEAFKLAKPHLYEEDQALYEVKKTDFKAIQNINF
jgi:valyl-tRNA synthetase